MAIHEPLPGSQQKQHRGLWIALSIIGGALNSYPYRDSHRFASFEQLCY